MTGGNTVEIIGRDPAKAHALAAARDGASVGTSPTGDLVIVAVPYASAVMVASNCSCTLVAAIDIGRVAERQV